MYFVVNTVVKHEGEFVPNKTIPVKIGFKQTDEIITEAIMKNDGINKVTITIDMHSVKKKSMNEETVPSLEKSESEKTFDVYRVFTELDFAYHNERAFLYSIIGAVAAPFVILAVKHVRDIAENR